MTPDESAESAGSPGSAGVRSRPVSAYLRRLGLGEAELAPSYDTLLTLHRAHLDAVPYENLATMLGRPPSVEPADCLARVAQVGRAGYCLHQNAVLELVLTELGFEVSRRHGHAWHDESERATGELDHLVLVVEGLATPANPGGRWWPDAGLGDGFRDPLPLVEGRHHQPPFDYEITHLGAQGWSFVHDRRASVAGVEVTGHICDQAAIEATHARLSTPPDGRFTHLVVVQRRNTDSADTLRGCVWTRVDAQGTHETELTSYDAWATTMHETLGLSRDGLSGSELRALHADQWARHLAWTAAGRP